ncbi:MAG: aldo/keto reductase [Hyphomonas sp.]|nr:aldo/keto reductase [Hyphomonas sp.]
MATTRHRHALEQDEAMEFRQLGRSGLKVTPFTLGTMEFGGKVAEDDAADLLAMAIERGINVVDTANCYGAGRSEEIVGKLIAPHRDKVLLATKFSIPMLDGAPNLGGTSRYNVVAACEASLKRLGTDHIDLYYIHRPFPETPIEETLRALDDLVSAGKVRAVGSSSFASWQLVEAQWCSDVRNLIRITAEQTAYHLLDRRVERELVPAALSHGVALTIWSPLAGGLLTGKYVDGGATTMRLRPDDSDWGAKHFTPQVNSTVAALLDVARQNGHTLTAMSLAWTLRQPAVASIVLGPRNRQQLTEQLDALDVVMDDAQAAAIDAIVPFGRATVPYYLDDQFANFSATTHGW